MDFRNRRKIVEIVEQWSKAHPQKTMMQNFFEKFPNAPKRVDGAPKMVCPYHVGYVSELEDCDNFHRKCLECWSRPLED